LSPFVPNFSTILRGVVLFSQTHLGAGFDRKGVSLSAIDFCRNEFSPAERASQTARRKAIYLELHPETAEHVAGGKGNATADNLSPVPSFAASTAAMTEKDERTIQRDAERGSKVIPEVIDMITGTYLDKIKRLPPNEQVIVAKRDLFKIRQNETAANLATPDVDRLPRRERGIKRWISFKIRC